MFFNISHQHATTHHMATGDRAALLCFCMCFVLEKKNGCRRKPQTHRQKNLDRAIAAASTVDHNPRPSSPHQRQKSVRVCVCVCMYGHALAGLVQRRFDAMVKAQRQAHHMRTPCRDRVLRGHRRMHNLTCGCAGCDDTTSEPRLVLKVHLHTLKRVLKTLDRGTIEPWNSSNQRTIVMA